MIFRLEFKGFLEVNFTGKYATLENLNRFYSLSLTMAREIEAKYKVADFELIRTKLISLGAILIGTEFQRNILFDYNDNRLLQEHKCARLRVINKKNDNAVATFKGPRDPNSQFKSAEEIEFNISDAEAFSKFLTGIGLVEKWVYEKHRTTYELNGMKVELDEVPKLGKFVEIEGAEEKIEETANLLGLSNPIKSSYLELAQANANELNFDVQNLIFDQYL